MLHANQIKMIEYARALEKIRLSFFVAKTAEKVTLSLDKVLSDYVL
jgi:hypothetical protein